MVRGEGRWGRWRALGFAWGGLGLGGGLLRGVPGQDEKKLGVLQVGVGGAGMLGLAEGGPLGKGGKMKGK